MVITVLWMGTMLNKKMSPRPQTFQKTRKAIAMCTLLKWRILRELDKFMGRPMQNRRCVKGLTPRHQRGMSLLPSQLGTCTALLPPSAGSGQLSADRQHTMSAASHSIQLLMLQDCLRSSYPYGLFSVC